MFSLTQEVPCGIRVGSASPSPGLGGARAGRTSLAKSLPPPPPGCASIGVTNPGPLPQPIAQRERQEPKCHLPEPQEPQRGRPLPAWGHVGTGASWILCPGSPGYPSLLQSHFLLCPDQEQRVSSLLSCGSQFRPQFPHPGCKEPLGVKTLHFSGCSSFRRQHFLVWTQQRFPELRSFCHL